MLPERFELREAQLEQLPDLLAFVERRCVELAPDAAVGFDLQLAVEEVFVNLVQHGYGEAVAGPVRVELSKKDGALWVTIRDEAPPFEPDSAPTPDVGAGLEERETGGLGLFLVDQLMDEVRYQPGYEGGNRLDLIKKLAPARSGGKDR